MQTLDAQFAQRIEDIKAAIQESELLQTYLDSEEGDDYSALKETFEPEIAALYEEVAAQFPLQLIALEEALLDEALEGLFLAKILGYAVLRPLINDKGQYHRPQTHLRNVLTAIANSGSYPELEKRIGQGVTVAFSLSTHVWVTSFVESIPNKIPRSFFNSHRSATTKTPEQRFAVYNRYKRQFASDNFATAHMPTTVSEATVNFPAVIEFLKYRFGKDLDNSTLVEPLNAIVNNQEFAEIPGYKSVLALTGMFLDMEGKDENTLRDIIRARSEDPTFVEGYFTYLASLHHSTLLEVGPEDDGRMSLRTGVDGDGLMQTYYKVVTEIHDKGINHLDAQDAIRIFMAEQEGLSDVAECVRQTVLRYFKQLIQNLDVTSYNDFFESTKLMAVHFEIFGNESMKQEVRTLSKRYVKSLTKHYTDKRGKDYQDIKKLVRSTFVDLGFMTEKEVVNFFKTKRVRAAANS